MTPIESQHLIGLLEKLIAELATHHAPPPIRPKVPAPTPEIGQWYSKIGLAGCAGRLATLTAEERKQFASLGGKARWAHKQPKH